MIITPRAMTLVVKGRRKGYVLELRARVGGDAALAAVLYASLAAKPDGSQAHPGSLAPGRSKA